MLFIKFYKLFFFFTTHLFIKRIKFSIQIYLNSIIQFHSLN